MSSGVVRSTALRAGGACVRCRKGKTKCVYENGRAPCKNCAKGMHECYLPSESVAHHHGQSPARPAAAHRPARDSLPASGAGPTESRQTTAGAGGSRQHPVVPEKLTPELIAECERIVTKTFPACVAFHKPSFVQQLKSASLDPALVCGLLTIAARSSPSLNRRFGSATQAAEAYASKAVALLNQNIDQPNLDEIQALCLVIIHEWGNRNAVRAYIYLGQAARMLQMYRILNGHHNPDGGDPFLRDESFRRTLWLIYILDCMLTSTPGRFPALTPQDTSDVALPCSDINFAFGNAVIVKSLRQHFSNAPVSPTHMPSGEIGEYGYIVLAATIWRDVVGMLATTNLHNFREEECTDLVGKIERLRTSLPMQLIDKPGQINLHMTMGSGYTFSMLHCLLHCATIFVHRRRLLQEVTVRNFNVESFRMSPRCHDLIDRLFTSCHGVISLLTAIETGAEKDSIATFPIFMLFSAFTASATVAYLSLKGLTPSNAVETAGHIVKDGLRFMQDGNDTWPLMGSWLRHLGVMQRVLNNDAAVATSSNGGAGHHPSISHGAAAVKDEVASNADTNPDTAMDYDQQSNSGISVGPLPPPRSVSDAGREGSEPPRRPSGVTTINGGSAAGSSTVTSPPPNHAGPVDAKQQTPEVASNGTAAADGQANQDMTAPELCAAFERQLLDLDDLAAFMGGGV